MTYRDAVIDFSNGSVFKLNPASPQDLGPEVAPLLVPGEQVVACFKAVRDFVVFTDKRLIAVNVQGMTGRKKDFTSLPYSKVQAFSIETAGTFDLDAELKIWISGSPTPVQKTFNKRLSIYEVQAVLASYVLK